MSSVQFGAISPAKYCLDPHLLLLIGHHRWKLKGTPKSRSKKNSVIGKYKFQLKEKPDRKKNHR